MSGATATGFQRVDTDYSDVNAMTFCVEQALARVRTAHPVVVKAVTNAGSVAAVGYVDVQPMVNQIDGLGNPTPHGIIHNIPYSRLQGGANAVIMDPVVGDLGVLLMADRDISAVKNTKAPANPGSFRRFDFSDGMYVAAHLNAAPTQYVQFNAGGITISSPTAITLTVGAASLTLTASGLSMTGVPITSDSDATFNEVSVHNHVHAGVASGSASTDPPTT